MAPAYIPKSEMTLSMLAECEKEAFTTGPMSVLTESVRNNTQVMISCRNNRKLLAKIKAFDRHCNMVLENVREIWTDRPMNGKRKKEAVIRDKYISKMFLRGDIVILVVKNPKEAIRQQPPVA